MKFPIRPPVNHSSGNWEKIERAKDKQPSVGVRIELVTDWVNVFREAESQWNINTHAPSCEIT